MSLIRYPGGKQKLSKRIVGSLRRYMLDHKDCRYIEPFFGAGAIGWDLISADLCKHVVINDIDPGMFCIWEAIERCPKELKQALIDFEPSVKAFDQFKEELQDIHFLEDEDTVEIAYKKIACHQMSFSGLGTKAGSVPGGKNQTHEKYHVGCRYNPVSLCRQIDKMHRNIKNLESVEIVNGDFDYCLDIANKDDLIYLDPPYYEKGPELYQFSFTDEDHERMARCLKKSKSPWLLSYDDCPEIRDLYKFAVVESLPLNYTINGSATKNELLIAPAKYADDLLYVEKPQDMFED